MIKLIIYITKLIIITITALLFASCNHNIRTIQITGSGNYITKERHISDSFKRIKTSNAIEVKIIQGENQSVVIAADDNIIDQVKTVVHDGILQIKLENNINFNFNSDNKILVTVTLPEIYGITASSASTVTNEGKIRTDQLELKASSASTISLTIEADKLEAESSSASTINLSGYALEADYDSSSASSIHAEELETNNIKAEASSGSTINVHPILKLDAEASSGSSIKYYKTPKSLNQNTHSGGSISSN